MILPIKQMIIQEGILDSIRENRGKLSLLGGAAAGAGYGCVGASWVELNAKGLLQLGKSKGLRLEVAFAVRKH